MPKTKNQGKNKSRFEVRGGLLNEYEFALNEGAMTEEERNRFTQAEEERALREGEEGDAEALPGSPQEREAARLREVMVSAHEKAQRNIEKRERREGVAKKGAGKGAAQKAAKTGAAKKAAGKKGGAARKGGTGQGAQKRGAPKKAAKKSAGKKSAKKSGAAGGRSAKGGAKKGSAKKGGGRGAR